MAKRFCVTVMAVMWAILPGCLDEDRDRDTVRDVLHDDDGSGGEVLTDQNGEYIELDNLELFLDAGDAEDDDLDGNASKDGLGSNAGSDWKPDFDKDPGPDQSEETWTIMMYQDADNNLETVLLNDINEMEESDIPSNVNIIVLVDRSSWYDCSDGNWSGAKLFKLTHDDVPKKINSIRLADPDFLHLSGTSKNGEELDMGAWETLDAFIQFCQKNFPADHYILHLSDHGDGWRYQWGLVDESAPNRAICTDDSSGNALTVSDDIPRAIENKGIEAMSFDACLMGTVEVAWALAPHVDYAALSVLNVPSSGWQYTDTLNQWYKHMSAKNWALNAVSSYHNYYYAHFDVGFTAVDLKKIAELQTPLEEFILSVALAPVEELRSVRNKAYRPDRMSAMAMRDIADFVLGCEPFLGQEKVANFLDSYEKAILYYWYSASQSKLRGLTIYAPGPSFIQGGPYSKIYDDTPFAKDTLWDEFISFIL